MDGRLLFFLFLFYSRMNVILSGFNIKKNTLGVFSLYFCLEIHFPFLTIFGFQSSPFRNFILLGWLLFWIGFLFNLYKEGCLKRCWIFSASSFLKSQNLVEDWRSHDIDSKTHLKKFCRALFSYHLPSPKKILKIMKK